MIYLCLFLFLSIPTSSSTCKYGEALFMLKLFYCWFNSWAGEALTLNSSQHWVAERGHPQLRRLAWSVPAWFLLLAHNKWALHRGQLFVTVRETTFGRKMPFPLSYFLHFFLFPFPGGTATGLSSSPSCSSQQQKLLKKKGEWGDAFCTCWEGAGLHWC